jgi:hypothetical protein
VLSVAVTLLLVNLVVLLLELEVSTYGVVGVGKVVEPTELDLELPEVRPGGVGIEGLLGADMIGVPPDDDGDVAGTFDPRTITGDRL